MTKDGVDGANNTCINYKIGTFSFLQLWPRKLYYRPSKLNCMYLIYIKKNIWILSFSC